MKHIKISQAKVHNLKNVDLELPKNKMIVFTGLSGSGKSSLAFDTIFAEGQRRYMESLSSYARQFLNQMDKPDVESIEGLSPAISIDQKSASHNPRSTVGTITEIYDYFRLMFASIGIPHCPISKEPMRRMSIQEMTDQAMHHFLDTTILILAPVIRNKKGEFQNVFDSWKKAGFSRARVDGTIYRLEEAPKLHKYTPHTIDIVVDRVTVNDDNKTRVTESIETALQQAKGLVKLEELEGDFSKLYSEDLYSPATDQSYPELSHRSFSFNSPIGACPVCKGLGDILDFDVALIIPEPDKPLIEGCATIFNINNTLWGQQAEQIGREHGFSLWDSFNDLSEKQQNMFLYGQEEKMAQNPYHSRSDLPDRRRRRGYRRREWEGAINILRRLYYQTQSEGRRFHYRRYMSSFPCPKCNQQRLQELALNVKINDRSIHDITSMSITSCLTFFKDTLELTEYEQDVTQLIRREIRERLAFLDNVGLGYLSLSRKANTLSGGEFQRIRLATQIGVGLTGVLYVLDEPSIGLHQRDNLKLIESLKRLRDLGNTLIVVEHDEETIRQADFIVDIGPKAGSEGGEIIYSGGITQLLRSKKSITADYLTFKKAITIPAKRRTFKDQKYLKIKGAKENNLSNISVSFPLKQFICVSGVSGSGKSTLVLNILQRALHNHFFTTKERVGQHTSIEGIEHIDKMISIDQSAIGRTPRSNPATYTGVLGPIRDLFAATPAAKMKGFKPGRFSFNVKGGRCESCQGDGMQKIEMHFLPDIFVTCEVCKGKRYNEHTLDVKYKGYSIADVLNMTVNKAVEIFQNIPSIASKLLCLQEVGLGYIQLGQSATTLSGGEAQRIKLAKELSKRSTGKTLYILDEPTTGLHFEDVNQLLQVLHQLVDKGNTMIVIEHNIDVLKTADMIIDLGPEGGVNGGKVVAKGTPEAVAKVKQSHTGQFLKEALSIKKT